MSKLFQYSKRRYPALKLRIIQTLDRHELENHFSSRLPHAIISVRRPGSRFSRSRNIEHCLARLDLMLHEWDVDDPPNPLPPVTLTSRQAMKIADFVGEQYQSVNQLIIQSEFASSQLTAIAETVGDWGGAFLERGDNWPTEHELTGTLLEMAFDALELAGHVNPRSLPGFHHLDHEIIELIEVVCSQTNVSMLFSPRITECFTLTRKDAAVIDTMLGVCLHRDERRYNPLNPIDSIGIEVSATGVEDILCSQQPHVCRTGDCTTCVGSLMRKNMPFCMAVVLSPRHLPRTFTSVLEAGGNWVVVTYPLLIENIKRRVSDRWQFRVTRRAKNNLVLITLGDSPACDLLHQIYRWLRG